MKRSVAMVAVLGLLCAVLTPVIGLPAAPPENAIASRYLNIWVQILRYGQWITLEANGPYIIILEDQHQEILTKPYDHWSFRPIPRQSYLYRIHPPSEVRYRFLVENKTDYRLGLLLSVDGLNTVDSKDAGGNACQERVWVLNPKTLYQIPGFQATDTQALAFYFTQRGQPHAPAGARYGEIRADVFLEPDALTAVLQRSDSSIGIVCNRDSIITPERIVDVNYLFTGSGEVIGSRVKQTTWQTLTCSPLETIVITYNRPVEPFFGIVGQTNRYFGVSVLYVIPWSPAEAAGIKAGDIISHVDGQLLFSFEQLQTVILNKKPGDVVRLRIHGTEGVREVRLGQW